MSMVTSYDGIELIKREEGFRAKVYKDAKGWSIGYGCFLSPADVVKYTGVTLSQKEAVQLLMSRVKPTEDFINKHVTVKLNQNQFDALVSFTYNVGVGAFGESTLLRLLNQGKYQDAAKQFSRFNLSEGKVLQNLVSRRAEEAALFLKAVV